MAQRKTSLPKFRKTLSTAMAALTLGFTVGAADAALVTGRFDPEFGGNLPGIGFQGSATFYVDDACLALDTGPAGAFVFSGNCGSSAMTFEGAHVDFYSVPGNAPSGTVDFLADPSAVIGVYILDHQVIGVQSTLIGPATSVGLLPTEQSFLLLFGSLNPDYGIEEEFTAGAAASGTVDPSQFQQTTMFVVAGNCSPATPTDCLPSNPANTTYVPEPGSAALVLAALLAAGGLRRRQA